MPRSPRGDFATAPTTVSFLLFDDDAVTVQFAPIDALTETAFEDRERCFAIREFCGRWGIPAGDLKA
jgi:hypothetical protein